MSGGPLSYEPFFGLKKKPFSLASDPEFLYESPSHSTALLTLLGGIRRREGLLAFTGDVGTGKTTICRAVLRNLDRTTFSAFIPDPFASREDLLRMLLIEFGVASVQDITTGPLAQAGRAQLSYLLSSFLDTLVPLDAFVVVFIDEAQNMSLSLLEEVRVLSDAHNRHGQLQLVFVGQLELLDKLKSPTMRQLDQRVSVYTQLDPLGADDVLGYVQHRLQIAGASPHRPMFAPMALSLVHEASGGIPRVINRICDRALHLAYEKRSPLIDQEIVAAVLESAPVSVARATAEPTRHAAEDKGEGAAKGPLAVESPAVFATKVDAWLTHLDGHGRAPSAPEVTSAAESLSSLPSEASLQQEPPTPFEPPLRRRQPERYIERLARRWARVAAMALLAFAGFNAAVAAASYVPARLKTLVRAQALLPPVPPPPALQAMPVLQAIAPALADDAVLPPTDAAQYSISVGAYSSSERAARMSRMLIDSGFQAFTRPLPLRGRMLHQVLLGPFAAESTAHEMLRRLRAAGDYGDAQVMPLR